MLSMSKFMCFLAILVTISEGNGLLYFQRTPSFPRHFTHYTPPKVITFEKKGFHHFTHFLEGFANGRFLVETQACLEGEQRQ